MSQPSSPLPSPPCKPRTPKRTRKKRLTLRSESFSHDDDDDSRPSSPSIGSPHNQKLKLPKIPLANTPKKNVKKLDLWRAKSAGNVNNEQDSEMALEHSSVPSNSTECLMSGSMKAKSPLLPPLQNLTAEHRGQGGSHGQLEHICTTPIPKLLLRRQSSLDSHRLTKDSPLFKETTYLVCNKRSPIPVEVVRFPFDIPASHPDKRDQVAHSPFTPWETDSETMSPPCLDTPSPLDLRSQSTTPDSLEDIM